MKKENMETKEDDRPINRQHKKEVLLNKVNP